MLLLGNAFISQHFEQYEAALVYTVWLMQLNWSWGTKLMPPGSSANTLLAVVFLHGSVNESKHKAYLCL